MAASRPTQLLASVIALAGVCAGPARAAVGDYIGKPVGSVRLVVEGRDTTDPAMTALVETEVGRPLSMAQVRETVEHLFSLGRFEDVRVDATLDNDRVALRYEMAPIHAVTGIRFVWNPRGPGIDEGALRRAIGDRFGATPSAGRRSEMVHVVTDALAERGYLRPSITTDQQAFHAPEHAIITLSIAPGVRTTVGDVEIAGTPSVGREEMLHRLHLAPGVPYESERLNARIQDYIADRRKHGYYLAKVEPRLEFQDADQRVVRLILAVDPGPHVRVVWAGDDVPAGMRAELVPVEREGSVDEDLLEDSTDRIADYLRGLGYRDAAAPHTESAADGELVITFTVTKGRQYRVAGVEVSGTENLPPEPAALRVKEGQPFSDTRIDADRSAIEDLYRRRGYAGAHVAAGADPQPPSDPSAPVPVRVRFVVTEGALTTVERVEFRGSSAINQSTLASIAELKPGAPLVSGRLTADRDNIQAAYQDRGYENATIQSTTDFLGGDRSRVVVTFDIQEGPQIFVDHVLIVGNVRTRTELIERELTVKAGQPLSAAKVNDSQRRLLALGLFRRVRINELRHGDETRRDVLVSLEESPPTTIGVGGGLEGKLIQRSDPVSGVASNEFLIFPRASFEIGRRNLFGKNRSVSLFSSLSQPVFTSTTNNQNLHEFRVIGTFREPRLFDTTADAFVNATVEQQIRSSFTYARQSLSADIARKVTPRISVTGTFQVQRTELVSTNVEPGSDDESLVHRLFAPEPLRISSFSSTVVRDTRDDRVNPRSGEFVSGSAQLAAKAIGSEIGFAKTIVTAQTFHTVSGSGGVVLAGNARLGLATEFDSLNPIPEPERFFAGGDNNRGFALDTLGVRHEVYDPDTDTIDAKGFAIGGNATVILNGEVRVPVLAAKFPDKFTVVGFLDSGNVFLHASQINLGDMRSSVGFGVRYQSPFGPFRFDLGFKTRTLTFFCPTIDDAAHQCVESRPALHISFGQAF